MLTRNLTPKIHPVGRLFGFSCTELALPAVNHVLPHRMVTNSKFDLQHPRSPHREKAKMLRAVKPLFAEDNRVPAEMCRKAKHAAMVPSRDLPPNPFETVLAREARRVLDGSQLIVLCHKNPVPTEDLKKYKNLVWKANIRMWPRFNNRVWKFAMEGGKLASITPFFTGSTLVITSPNMNLWDMNRGLKRMEQLVPLFVVVNHQFVLSMPQLNTFAAKYGTGITAAHGELVSLLSNPTGGLMQALQYEAMTLSQALDFVSKEQPAESASSSPPPPDTTSI